MKTTAYLRVSKDPQDVRDQRLAILEFARQEKIEISAFISLSASPGNLPKARQIDLLIAQLEPGDTLVASAMSRMGRTPGEVIATVGALLKQQVRFLAIKEGLRLVDEQDLHSMVILLERYLGIERNILWREYQYHGGAWPFREVDQTWEKEAQARLEVEKRLEHVEDQFRQMQDRLQEELAAREALEAEIRELRQRGR